MDLNPRFVLGDLDLTDYPFGIEFGSDLGNAESVTDVLASLLADGEIESLSRRSNRTLTIPLLVEASDLGALADAEASLIAECDKQRNTLSVDPGDGYGPATVFETFAASPARVYDDDTERAGYRRWVLTIRALPYGRSVDKVVDNAGTPPSTGVVVYGCDSATGWSKWATGPGAGGPVGTDISVDTTIKTEGTGSVRAHAESSTYNSGDNSYTFLSSDKVAGLTVSTSTGGYLSIGIQTTFSGRPTDGLYQLWMTTAAGESQVTNFVSVGRDVNGFARYVWPVAAGLTVTGLRFWVTQTRNSQTGTVAPYVYYDDVERATSATTDHQIVKQLDVQGSARTVGSLHIAAPTDSVALGRVLAITAPTAELPAGFTPDGRRWITQGTTTTDSTSPDGSYLTPSTTTYDSGTGKPIFDVPVTLLTAGPYTMVALVKVESSPTVAGVQAQLRVGSNNVGPTSTAEVSLPNLATGYQFVTLGTCYLPPLPMQSADVTAKVRLLFKGAKLSNVYFIPAWQVGGRPVADFSIIDCGTAAPSAGGSSSNLWIDSPSTDQPQGGWWRGPTSDRANAQSAWPDAKKPGVHAFKPGELTAFLVSTNAQGPTMALEYYPAWFGSAAL
ncbi:hypothetical protein [Nocardioides sp. URHA0032]|uniref:hypothetical protein n=1 Tax=Nocardioides sp. URHA0032 TaxID=1380388 RepID=UPI00048E7F9C|nr:hypothetical protein [Nocardioides sp. URHA0032]